MDPNQPKHTINDGLDDDGDEKTEKSSSIGGCVLKPTTGTENFAAAAAANGAAVGETTVTTGKLLESDSGKSDLMVFLDVDMTMIYKKRFWAKADADQYIATLPKHPKTGKAVEYVMLEERFSTNVVLLRPGVQEFVQKVSKTFDTHIFTAGSEGHADDIAAIVDPNKEIFFKGRNIWYDDHCQYQRTKNDPRIFAVKNLSKLPPVQKSKNGSKRAVLVDDWNIHEDTSPMILVEEFLVDPSDNELDRVSKILESLADNKVDVRLVLPTLVGDTKENIAGEENQKEEERTAKKPRTE